jgi:uncharacterized protein with HEPN domain
MKSKIGDKVRLEHILDAIELIEKSLFNKTDEDFQNDFILQAAIIRWVGIVGEASSKITKEFKSKNSDVEWKSIEGLRHVIVHEYFGVDLERIWVVTQIDIPELKVVIKKLIKEFDESVSD